MSTSEEIQYSRGRQPNRPSTQLDTQQTTSTTVPLRFVHVPQHANIHMSQPLSNRTPSVPDFARMASTSSQQQSTPHLSGEVLRIQNAVTATEDPMELFEERLKRAQLTIQLDRSVDSYEAVTRMRSRSTPSRGGYRLRGGEDVLGSALRLEQVVNGNIDNEAKEEETNSNHNQSAKVDYARENNINSIAQQPSSPLLLDIVQTPQSLPTTETNTTPIHNRIPSTVSSTSIHRIPSPPPLPPPSSERDRLVQREREARGETERARRRHLALLRERELELEENSDAVLLNLESGGVRNERPTSVGSLDVVDLNLLRRDVSNDEVINTGMTMRNERPTSVGSLDVVNLNILQERRGEEDVVPLDSVVSLRNDRPSSVGSIELFLSDNAVEESRDDVRGGDVVEAVDSFEVGNHDVTSASNEMHPTIQFRDMEFMPHNNSQISQQSINPQSCRNNELSGNGGIAALGLSDMSDGRMPLGADIPQNTLNHLPPTTNSISTASVGSTSHISGSQPPPLPQPATEKERLVLREREARLETERARRRHIALLREQGNDLDDGAGSNENCNNSEGREEGKQGNASGVENNRGETGTSNYLSYTMEKFLLETLADEEANNSNTLTAVGLTMDESVNNGDSAPLPYTMELFLSENAAITESNDGVGVGIANDVQIIDSSDHETAVMIQQQTGSDHSDQNSNISHELADNVSELVAPSISNNDNAVEPHTLPSVINYDDMPPSVINHDMQAELSPDILHEERFLRVHTLNDEAVFGLPPSDRALDFNVPPTDGISPLNQSIDGSTQFSESALFTPQIMPRLTEEGVAQLAEVDQASIGNAPPLSLRDEPSESSIPDQGHPMSIVTQTTILESVTETSQGTSDINHSVVHQRTESADVIRVQDAVDEASNISVEAMPSVDSVIDSRSDNHVLSNSSSSNSSPQTSALESHLSSDEESQIISLTEAGVVAMEEIDCASLGNVPPRSLRDERLSESSVLGTRSTLSYGMFPNPSGGTMTGNASVEAMPSVDSVNSMSQDSVDAMPSEYNGNSLNEGSNETGDEDLLACQASDMVSSTSIEALPSIDLGSELEDDPFASIMHNGSNETEDEDLIVYQASDMASSTSIEALPSDDLSSEREFVHSPVQDSTHLNGFSNDHFINQNGTERTPLLPIVHNDNGVLPLDSNSGSEFSKELTPVLVSFASGCFIGLGVGIFLFNR